MSITRLWVIGGIAVTIAVFVLGWIIGVSPQLAAAQIARSDKAAVDAQNQSHEIALAQLREQFDNIDELREELDELRERIPGSQFNEDFADEVQSAALASGLVLSKIEFGEAVPFGESAAAPAEGETAIEGALYSIPVTVTVVGEPLAVIGFSQALQGGTRHFIAPKLTIGTTGGTISGFIFVIHDSKAVPKYTAPSEEDTTDETPAEEQAPEPTPTPTESAAPSPEPTETPSP